MRADRRGMQLLFNVYACLLAKQVAPKSLICGQVCERIVARIRASAAQTANWFDKIKSERNERIRGEKNRIRCVRVARHAIRICIDRDLGVISTCTQCMLMSFASLTSSVKRKRSRTRVESLECGWKSMSRGEIIATRENLNEISPNCSCARK